MYARLLDLRLAPGATPAFAGLYRQRISPTLTATPGCLGAVALAATGHEEKILSLTLWRAAEAADAYDREGRFGQLLGETASLFPGRDRDADPLDDEGEELVIEGYAAELALPPALGRALSGVTFARTIVVEAAAGREEEIERRAWAAVNRAAEEALGLVSIFLMRGLDRRERTLVLGLWESEEAAGRWERSEPYLALLRDLESAGLAAEITPYRVLCAGAF